MVTYSGDMTLVAETQQEFDDYMAMFQEHPNVRDIVPNAGTLTITLHYEVEVV